MLVSLVVPTNDLISSSKDVFLFRSCTSPAHAALRDSCVEVII
jgi:hypothetical protein